MVSLHLNCFDLSSGVVDACRVKTERGRSWSEEAHKRITATNYFSSVYVAVRMGTISVLCKIIVSKLQRAVVPCLGFIEDFYEALFCSWVNCW